MKIYVMHLKNIQNRTLVTSLIFMRKQSHEKLEKKFIIKQISF